MANIGHSRQFLIQLVKPDAGKHWRQRTALRRAHRTFKVIRIALLPEMGEVAFQVEELSARLSIGYKVMPNTEGEGGFAGPPIVARGPALLLTLSHSMEAMSYAHIFATAGMARVRFDAKILHDYDVGGHFEELVETEEGPCPVRISGILPG